MIENKEYFVYDDSTPLKRGTRFLDEHKPTENTLRDFNDSKVHKTPVDRAKEDSASVSVNDLNGHVVAATDTQAKANQAKKDDRTLAVQPSQLPTSEGGEDESFVHRNLISDGSSYVFDDDTVYIGKTVGVEVEGTTRNQYILGWADSMVSFFKSLGLSLDSALSKIQELKNISNTHTTQINSLLPAEGEDSLQPIGSTTFHLNPSFAENSMWRKCDGTVLVDIYTDPLDDQSPETAIFQMLAPYNPVILGLKFYLPDLNGSMAMANGSLGYTVGAWGGTIDSNNLPRHTHDQSKGATMKANDLTGPSNGVTYGGLHTHSQAWNSSTGKPSALSTGSNGEIEAGSGIGAFIRNNETDFTLSTSGNHNHYIDGATGTHSDDWGSSPSRFLFTPPTFGGVWLIKIN